jgi:molybdopterin-guanine dinucleotide biosynthesis protein A
MKRLINQDRLKVTGFYKGLKCLTIPEAIQKTFAPDMRMFINVNTLEDLARLQTR